MAALLWIEWFMYYVFLMVEVTVGSTQMSVDVCVSQKPDLNLEYPSLYRPAVFDIFFSWEVMVWPSGHVP